MDTILYNPRKFNGKDGVPVPNLFNPDTSQKQIVLPEGIYEPMMPNELKRYPTQVANAIIKRWSFVRKIQPEDLDGVRKEMAKKEFQCDVAECDFETASEKGLQLHKSRKHKLSDKEMQAFESIPVASSKTVETKIVNGVEVSPEGIPVGGTPQNPVNGFYGPGEEDLSSSMRIRKPGSPGVF